MATVPCDLCGETVFGKLLGFYVTVVRDGLRLNRRLKLCEGCVNKVQSVYSAQWSDGFILNRFTAESECCQCHEVRGERGTLHPLYCTCYSLRGNRFDYYAAYCSTCAGAIIDTFQLTESSNGRAA